MITYADQPTETNTKTHSFDRYEYNVNVLMPEYFYPGDENWIREMLLHLDVSTRSKISVAYADVYKSEHDKEIITYKKNGMARKAANKRLREFVRKYSQFSRGYVTTPELLK